MEDPVKSTACGHCFSRQGILQHIKTCKKDRKECLCPMPGCNNPIQEAQLEVDVGLQRIIKRVKRRQEAEEQQRKQSQAMDDDDEEDEE